MLVKEATGVWSYGFCNNPSHISVPNCYKILPAPVLPVKCWNGKIIYPPILRLWDSMSYEGKISYYIFKYYPGTHFTKYLWVLNQYFVKIPLAFIIILRIQSGHKFAHDMTAELLCHVQKCDLGEWIIKFLRDHVIHTKVWPNLMIIVQLRATRIFTWLGLWTHMSSNTHLRAISQEILQPSITNISLKITYQKFH